MSLQSSKFDHDNTIIITKQNLLSKTPSNSFKVVAAANNYKSTDYVYNQDKQEITLGEFTSGINPLIRCASKLFLEIAKLKRSGLVTQLETLRNRLESEIRGFNSQAVASSIPASQINAAQYLLCTALDESVVNALEVAKKSQIKNKINNNEEKYEIKNNSLKENLNESDWQGNSLLSTFHKDTWGGEVFFDVLARAMEQPVGRLFLLEFIYLLLSFGFEGKYRIQDYKGLLTIESLRDQIYRQIRLLRGEPKIDLSPMPSPIINTKKKCAHVSMLMVISILILCFTVTFTGFYHILNKKRHIILAQYDQYAPIGHLVSCEETKHNQVIDKK